MDPRLYMLAGTLVLLLGAIVAASVSVVRSMRARRQLIEGGIPAPPPEWSDLPPADERSFDANLDGLHVEIAHDSPSAALLTPLRTGAWRPPESPALSHDLDSVSLEHRIAEHPASAEPNWARSVPAVAVGTRPADPSPAPTVAPLLPTLPEVFPAAVPSTPVPVVATEVASAPAYAASAYAPAAAPVAAPIAEPTIPTSQPPSPLPEIMPVIPLAPSEAPPLVPAPAPPVVPAPVSTQPPVPVAEPAPAPAPVPAPAAAPAPAPAPALEPQAAPASASAIGPGVGPVIPVAPASEPANATVPDASVSDVETAPGPTLTFASAEEEAFARASTFPLVDPAVLEAPRLEPPAEPVLPAAVISDVAEPHPALSAPVPAPEPPPAAPVPPQFVAPAPAPVPVAPRPPAVVHEPAPVSAAPPAPATAAPIARPTRPRTVVRSLGTAAPAGEVGPQLAPLAPTVPDTRTERDSVPEFVMAAPVEMWFGELRVGVKAGTRTYEQFRRYADTLFQDLKTADTR